MHNDITEAIMAESQAEIAQPYSTARKIKGFLRNQFSGGVRNMTGAAGSSKDVAKHMGAHAVAAVPAVLALAAKQIPVVGSAAGSITKLVGGKAAAKIQKKLDAERRSELRAKEVKGTLSVKEMTELFQREDKAISKEHMEKMHDAIRKLDESYAAARSAIQGANECESIYKAAKAYAYLKYRVLRMNWYIELVQAHLDELRDVTDRYSAQVIGYEADLMDGMDEFFKGPGYKPEYHKANCKNKQNCYYHAHGLTT